MSIRILSRTLAAAALVAVTLGATACKDKGGSCDKVVDHTMKLAGMPSPTGAERKEMIAQCEKQPAKVRECALAAKELEGMMSCK